MTERNLLIHGDCIQELKALLKTHKGLVKCVYIDPPYNTKKRLTHYNDNMTSENWLLMMKDALKGIKDLMTEDGSVWINIDDRESHYLKVLCDEIFGRKNFIANVIWEKKYSCQNDCKYLSDNHDHILVFVKNIKQRFNGWKLPRTQKMNDRYKNYDDDPRGRWSADGLCAMTRDHKCLYEITTPTGRIVKPPPGRSWRFSKKRFDELLKDNRIWFGRTGNNVPSLKRFLSEVQDGAVSRTIWKRTEVGDNQESKRETLAFKDRKSTRLNSSHIPLSRMPSSA